MSILIKDMEMPIFEHQSWDIHKGTDGKWYMVDNNAETSDRAWHEIVPVPPHGRLIDADAFLSTIRPICDADANAACTFETVKRLMIEHISEAPTIIPAEGEE